MVNMEISVVIPAYNAVETIGRCLAALEAQTQRDVAEVIVVDSSTDGTDQLVQQKFPQVRLFHFDGRMYPGEARNYGVRQATGEIIAFVDADCWVKQTWLAEILQAHRETRHPVVGGAIANGNPESYVGWGYYFSSFSQWMPQGEPFARTDIPAGCLSCQRWVLEKYGGFPEGKFCEDTVLMWRLAEVGYGGWFVPTIQVFHYNFTNLGAVMWRKLIHGKTFAQVRVRQEGYSVGRRVLGAIATPLVPFLLLYRRTQDVVKSGMYRQEFLFALPVTILGILCWCLGEGIGYAYSLFPHSQQPSKPLGV
jgi:glycosyltransferase involved in cell wall biosynthesis